MDVVGVKPVEAGQHRALVAACAAIRARSRNCSSVQVGQKARMASDAGALARRRIESTYQGSLAG